MGNLSKEKVLALAKGFRGRNKNCNSIARTRVDKALQHAYRHRKEKKRETRALWIQQVNAAVRDHEMRYSEFIHSMKKADIEVNRKVLAELAYTEPLSFRAIVEICKAQ